jgi:hypothetical protein
MIDNDDKIEGVALKIIELFGAGVARVVRKHADDAAIRGDSPFAHVLFDISEVIERLVSSYGQAQILTIH